MYEDHLKTGEYCQSSDDKNKAKVSKPTIFIKSASSYGKHKKPTILVKSASSYRKEKKLTELAAIIKGTLYPSLEPIFQSKGASANNIGGRPGPIEREVKLKALGKIVKGRVH
jgi:hypothetical protein